MATMLYLKCTADAQKAIGLRKEQLDTALAGLAQLLAMQGLQAETITQTVAQCGTGRYAKTDSRKTLGCMNDLVRCYTVMVEAQGGLKACDVSGIILKINDMPQRTLNWANAWEVTEALLASPQNGQH